MADVLGCQDYGAESRRMEQLGVDIIVRTSASTSATKTQPLAFSTFWKWS